MDGSLKLWDLRRACLSYTMRAHKGPVLAAAFSADGLIASAGADQRILLWASNVDSPSGTTATSALPLLASPKRNRSALFACTASSLCRAAATSIPPYKILTLARSLFVGVLVFLSDDMLDACDALCYSGGLAHCLSKWLGRRSHLQCSLRRQCDTHEPDYICPLQFQYLTDPIPELCSP